MHVGNEPKKINNTNMLIFGHKTQQEWHSVIIIEYWLIFSLCM